MSVHHEGGERAREPELPPNTAFGFAPFPVRPRRGEEAEAAQEEPVAPEDDAAGPGEQAPPHSS